MKCFFQLREGVQRHCKDCPKPNRKRIVEMESGKSVIICTEINKALTGKNRKIVHWSILNWILITQLSLKLFAYNKTVCIDSVCTINILIRDPVAHLHSVCRILKSLSVNQAL